MENICPSLEQLSLGISHNHKMLVEMSGTPSSGKTSVINKLSSFDSHNFKVINGESSTFDYKNSNFEIKIFWSIFDTYSKVRHSGCFQDHAVTKWTIFNRGLFDRIIWAKLLSTVNNNLAEEAKHLEQWLKKQATIYRSDLIFLFLTSYEKIIARKPQYLEQYPQPPWVVNKITIQKLNSLYIELFEELKDDLKIVMIDDLRGDLSLEQKISIVKGYINI